MYNKNLKVLSLLLLVAPLAACGGKPGITSDAGSESGGSDVSESTEVNPTEPKKVEMTFQEAYAKISADDAVANDALLNGASESYEMFDKSNQAVYMSLKVSDEVTGQDYDVAEWDYWSKHQIRDDLYTNKVATSSYEYWSGDGTTDPCADDEFLTSKGSEQTRYISEDKIGTFKDEAGLTYNDDGDLVPYENHGLYGLEGQAYCDWWDLTYGTFKAAQRGMYTMEKFDAAYFSAEYLPNTQSAQFIAMLADDYFEDGVKPVVAVDAYEDFTTVSIEAFGDFGQTLGEVNYFDETGNGYSGWKDAEIYQTLKYTAVFETETGFVTSYELENTFDIRTNPNKGIMLKNPFVIQKVVTKVYDFAKNGEFDGELAQLGEDDFDVRFLDLFFKDDDCYWNFGFKQGEPTAFLVNLDGATSASKAMVEGWSISRPHYYDKEAKAIVFESAKAHTYTAADGTEAKAYYTFTCTINADGNLVVTYVNENNETITEVYYSSANWAAMKA